MRRTLLPNHCPLWHTPFKQTKLARNIRWTASIPIAHCYFVESHVHIFSLQTDWNWHWLHLGEVQIHWEQEFDLIPTLGAPGKGGLTTWATPLGSGNALTTAIALKMENIHNERSFKLFQIGSHLTSSIMLGSLRQVCLAKELITCYIQLHPVREKLRMWHLQKHHL